ncbi:MAG TPA: DUF1501 domain-containing protein [Pirellulales bacterium]|jgi:hypothetical protein|nr:DUF1501 domain-containing protein [Pirellulales bacterium]
MHDESIQRQQLLRAMQRRTFLRRSAYGIGGLALASLLEGRAAAGDAAGSAPNQVSRGFVNPTHYPVRARRIIHLCMAGGPSHLESFDYKPELKKLDKQPFPESFTKGQQLAQLQNAELKAAGPFCEFAKHGNSGQEISSLFPHIAKIADDICIVRSMHTEQINHDPAHAFMNSGSIIKGRPSIGSWLLYGLGAETDELPGFIVLTSAGKSGLQPVSARQWSSGFLPTRYQGILFQSKGDAVHYVGNPAGVTRETQGAVVDEVNRLNRLFAAEHADPEIQTRISQYELAFRMQMSVPDLTDFASEPQSVLEMYGVKEPGDGSFASNCLLARRLAERGVRFIQLYHRAWDHHNNIANDMPRAALDVDQASAALVRDLKQRGMLDDTLIVWGGEFGRTPMGQGSGRDHHINAFSIWLAGGGIRGGMTWGRTDELGYKYVADDQAMHVHDLHATMLYLCGIDHSRFSVKFQGLDARLTGVEPCKVVRGILA